MQKIKPTNIRVRLTGGGGLFHDSREDVRQLGNALNAIIEKQNEIINMVNWLAMQQSKSQ